VKIEGIAMICHAPLSPSSAPNSQLRCWAPSMLRGPGVVAIGVRVRLARGDDILKRNVAGEHPADRDALLVGRDPCPDHDAI
jgi:hypothetical protein